LDQRRGGEFYKLLEDWICGIEERMGEKPSLEDQTGKVISELVKLDFDFKAFDLQRRKTALTEAIKNLKPSEFIEDRTPT
jgi:hypothetical protein